MTPATNTSEKIDNRILTMGQAAWKSRCPRCRQGNIFEGKAYGLKLQKMNENCPDCGLRYEREPGYFYVSMFVSYALSVAEMVTACMLTYFLTGNDDSFWLYLTVAMGIVIILAPFNYRYSRVILLYYLTPGLHYVPNIASQKDDGKPVNN